MASLRKKKTRRREMRDDKLAKKRLKKTRVRDRKQQEQGALFVSSDSDN